MHQLERIRKRSNEIGTKYPVAISLYIFVIVALCFLYIRNIPFLEGDDLICLSTIFLGITTIYLALIGKQSAEKDRRRLRIKEQLEGLYSPLIGLGKKEFIPKEYHMSIGTYKTEYQHIVQKEMVKLRSTYKFLAENELKKSLDNYYEKEFDDFQKMYEPQWSAFIEPIWNKITEDFDSLSKEYSDLTRATHGD